MAIKEVIAFEHLPVSGNVTYAGIPGVLGGATAVVKTILNRKRLSFSGMGCLLRLDLSQFNLDYSKRVIIGYRFQTPTTSCYAVAFGTPAIARTYQTPAVRALALGILANADVYIEVMLDYETGMLTVFVDGIAKLSRALAGEGTSYPSLGLGSDTSNGTPFNVTDIYVRDSSGEEEDISPFGSVICSPITVATAEGDTWAASNGDTLAGALNTPFVALSESTPTINSAVSATAGSVTVGLAASVEPYTIVEAVKILASAKDTIAPSRTIKGSLELNGSVANGKSLLLTTAMQPNKPLGCFNKAPDGSAWTIAKVNQSTVSVTVE